jgi:hypothetical protein
MLKKYNDNILCRLFERIADIWSKAAQYQIFVILASIALLVIMPLFEDKLNNTINVIFNIAIFCAAAVAGFLLFRAKGSQMAAFTFATALLLRLCLVLVLETSTPNMLEGVRIRTSPWINHYDATLFQPDEYFYFYYGQEYKDSIISEFTSLPQFEDQACRAGFLLSRIFRYFGEQSLWPRLVGAFLGAFAAALIYLAAKEFFSDKTCLIISLLSVIAPQTAFYSVRFLKEIWIIFAAGMMVFSLAAIIRNKRILPAILWFAAAEIVLVWVRLEYGLVFILAMSAALYFRYKNDSIGRIISVIITILLGTIIFVYQFKGLADKSQIIFDRYTNMEKTPDSSFEVVDKIYKSRGPQRILNIPLTLLYAIPKNLHHIYSEENKLYDIVRLSDIYQWWLPLPFLIIGATVIVIKRTEFMVFLLPYIIIASVSALLLGGLQIEVLRYRDSLAPVAFIIIGTGIESYMTSPKGWKTKVILAVYAVFILLAINFSVRFF